MKFKHEREIKTRFFEVKENEGEISWYLENSDRILYYDDTLDSIWYIGLRLYYFYNFYNYFYKKNKEKGKIYSLYPYFVKFKEINKFTRGNLNYQFKQSYILDQSGKVIEKVLIIELTFTYIETSTYEAKTLSFIYLG
jgi:hypothetical protein